MKFSTLYRKCGILGILFTVVALSACEKDGNPNNLPELDPNDYAGTVGGFRYSDEIFPENLVAYFSFDDTYEEKFSKATPTSKTGDAFVAGFKGKAVDLNAGYLYYGTQLNALKTDVFKSFTISQWVQIANNGSKRTMLFTIARPGVLQGSLNINLNTQSTNANFLGIQPVFATVGGGTQDNLNANVSPKFGAGNWVNIVLSYNGATGRFNIIANGVNVGSYSDRGVGNNLFKSYEPSELIFGANYNLVPGKQVNADAAYARMTGKIDEVKIYNAFIPDPIVKAMYELSLAGK